MKANSLKTLLVLISLLMSLSAFSASKDCTGDCIAKTALQSVQPDKGTTVQLSKDVAKAIAVAEKRPLVIVKTGNRSPAEENSKEDYQYIFCHKFAQIEGNLVGLTIKELEAIPYSIDEIITTPACQPEGYSAVVKSPISHIIADDPSKRVGFLNTFYLYYTKKRKDPAKFLDFVNAKNTEGETLLDYIESLQRRDGKYYSDGTKASITQIVSFACSHGAVYSVYPEKKCP